LRLSFKYQSKYYLRTTLDD